MGRKKSKNGKEKIKEEMENVIQSHTHSRITKDAILKNAPKRHNEEMK